MAEAIYNNNPSNPIIISVTPGITGSTAGLMSAVTELTWCNAVSDTKNIYFDGDYLKIKKPGVYTLSFTSLLELGTTDLAHSSGADLVLNYDIDGKHMKNKLGDPMIFLQNLVAGGTASNNIRYEHFSVSFDRIIKVEKETKIKINFQYTLYATQGAGSAPAYFGLEMLNNFLTVEKINQD
jgi:hypothetical protein